MAVSHQGVFVQTPEIVFVTATHGDSTNKKTIFTSATSGQGTKIVSLTAINTIASNRVCQIFVAGNQVTANTIAASAGNDGSTINTNMLALWAGLPLDNDGQPYFFLKAGNTLQASVTVAVTTNKQITWTAIGADF